MKTNLKALNGKVKFYTKKWLIKCFFNENF